MPTLEETQERIARLRDRLERILSKHPDADRENVWHTLLLLEQEPIERLRRSLTRGRGNPIY